MSSRPGSRYASLCTEGGPLLSGSRKCLEKKPRPPENSMPKMNVFGSRNRFANDVDPTLVFLKASVFGCRFWVHPHPRQWGPDFGCNGGVFPFAPTRLSEAERNPLRRGASSATLNAHRTANELGRGPDMRRNVPKLPFLAPQPKAREKNLGRRRTACQKQKCILYASMFTLVLLLGVLRLCLGRQLVKLVPVGKRAINNALAVYPADLLSRL